MSRPRPTSETDTAMPQDQEYKLKNFYLTPRRYFNDLQEGWLLQQEYDLLLWLRARANIYGIASCTIMGLRGERFPHLKPGSGDNHINKLLLSLKRKKCIWYEERRGRRGAFAIHLDEWALPGKRIKRLDQLFGRPEVRGADNPETTPKSEAAPNSLPPSQNLEDEDFEIAEDILPDEEDDKLRTPYNDTDTETDTDTLSPTISDNDLSIAKFKPQNKNEEKLFEIAQVVGEKNMKFLLAKYHKHGIAPVERAYGKYQRTESGKIRNKASFFNSLVQKEILNT